MVHILTSLLLGFLMILDPCTLFTSIAAIGYIDKEINNTCARGADADISAKGAKVKTFVIPTNEELVIARETYALVK